MAKAVYFTITSGLAGCYMPDNVYGPYAVTTRRELVSAMREELEAQDFPKRSIHDVKWREVWRHAKRHGSISSLSLCIKHKGMAVTLWGMTEAEYEAAQEEA